MKKSNIIAAVACAALLITVPVTTCYCYSVSSEYDKTLNDYKYSENIEIYSDGTGGIATAETAETAEVSDNTEATAEVTHFNSLNVVESGGAIRIKDSTLKLKTSDDKIVLIDAQIKSDSGESENFTAQYDETLDGCVLASVINVSIKENSGTGYGVGRFTTEDGSEVVTGRKKLDETHCIQATAVSNEEYSGERLQTIIENLINSAEIVDSAKATKVTMNVLGMNVKNPESVSVRMTRDILELDNGQVKVYVSPYNKSLTGAGLDKSFKIGETSLKYGNLKDSATGYMPFMVNGDYGNVKISAVSSDDLNSLFG